MGGGFVVVAGILLMVFLFDSGHVAAGVIVAICAVPAAIAFEVSQKG